MKIQELMYLIGLLSEERGREREREREGEGEREKLTEFLLSPRPTVFLMNKWMLWMTISAPTISMNI